jgi:hypothetical protein
MFPDGMGNATDETRDFEFRRNGEARAGTGSPISSLLGYITVCTAHSLLSPQVSITCFHPQSTRSYPTASQSLLNPQNQGYFVVGRVH